MKSALSPPLVLALCLLPGSAGAFDLTIPTVEQLAKLEITNTLIFDHHDENSNGNDLDDHYFDIQNHLNLKFSLDRFTLATRFDAVGFSGTPDTGVEPGYLNRVNLEKLSAEYRGRQVKVVLGDFYASFGRGLALTVRKTDQLGEDNTLQGAKVQLRTGELEVVALSGLLNPSNLDLYEKTIRDPYDLVNGLRVSYRLWDAVVVGLQGVGIWFDPLDQNNEAVPGGVVPDYATVAGMTIDLPTVAEVASIYGEFNWLGSMPRSTEFVKAQRHDGFAAYLAASLSLGDVNLTVEGKYYDEYQLFTWTPSLDEPPSSWGNWLRPLYADDIRFNDQRLDLVRLPTLEPAQMEVANNWDVYGGRVQVDYRPGAGQTLLFVSYSALIETDWGISGPAGRRMVHNAQVGVEQDFLSSGRMRLAGGVRRDAPLYEGEVPEKELYYQDFLLKVPLTERHSLDFHGTNWIVHERNPDLDFLKGEWSLGYAWSPWLSASILFGYDTSPSGRFDLRSFYTDPDTGQSRRQLFLAASLAATLWGKYILKLRAGQLRGGLICIDGACKIVPPAAGVRAEWTMRF